MAGPKRWWILQKTLREFYQMCLCVLNLKEMCNANCCSRFRFVLSPHPTASLLYLSKRCGWASSEELEKVEHIEVCPKAMELTEQIADRISSDGGGALIIDYGKDGIVSDSLQVWILKPFHYYLT